MVQSAKNWCRQNAPDDLNCPRYGRVLAQRQMCACAVIIVRVRTKYVTQMPLAEHHDMIKTFAPDRTDQPFSMSILPWRSRRRWSVTYAHRANASGKDVTKGPITIVNEILGCVLPAKRFGELSRNPFAGRMSRNAYQQDLPPLMS